MRRGEPAARPRRGRLGATALAAFFVATAAAPVQAMQEVPALPDGLPDALFTDDRSRELLTAQVLLDRAHYSPGVIDGYGGGNTRGAITAFERAHGLAADGEIDDELMRRLADGRGHEVLKKYTITDDDVEGPFIDTVPESLTEQARLDRLGYTGAEELLAEKFHMSQALLRALNPGADFARAGAEIVVAAPGDDRREASVARIEVDKSRNMVRAYDEDGALLASYPATIGSDETPSPTGKTQVRAVAPEATYHFDPASQDWGPDEALKIAAGPNNPVGGVWIDLDKEGYGIHGSPDPGLIGKTASHGCVRLTNWDARELAAAVSEGVGVEFIER